MEEYKHKARSKTNTLSQRELKQESKSWEAVQQSILIYLLTEKGYIITIERPDKFAHLSKHFFIVTSLRNNRSSIDLTEKISSLCAQLMKPTAKQCHQKQLKRHCDKSRCSLSVNLLIEIAQSCGYSFTTRGTRSSIYTIKMQKFSEILKDGKTLFKKDDILALGSQVNDKLREVCIESSGKPTVDIYFEQFYSIANKKEHLDKMIHSHQFTQSMNNAMNISQYNAIGNSLNNSNLISFSNSLNSSQIAKDSLIASDMNRSGRNINDERIEEDNNSSTADDYVSRSTSRGEISDRNGNALSVFKKVTFGRYYFVIPNKTMSFQ